MRYLIRISYDGLYFIGSQKQKEGRTIQGEFENLLSKLFNEKIKVIICSRLDAKVSAKDFVLTFDTNNLSNIFPYQIKRYLQNHFASELLIKELYEVSPSFHPRHNVRYKIYSYKIDNRINFDPLNSSHALVVKKKLELRKIKEITPLFIGEHNYVFFTKDCKEKNTNLSIEKIQIKKKKGYVFFIFKGKSFLKYQIRFIVGAFILYSENKISKNSLKHALSGKVDNKYIKMKVDGCGLTLEKIVYEKGITDEIK